MIVHACRHAHKWKSNSRMVECRVDKKRIETENT